MAEAEALPRGTVTFLFTDIEGSTRRWQQDSTAMGSAVARHVSLLREAVVGHGGVLFKVIGDATQSAFPTAPAALAAALAAQQALHGEPWPDVIGGVAVRMALHTGEAQPDSSGDYLAPSLNRLARLLAAGHGGQILLSQVATDLVRNQLPEGTRLRDLGMHRLRDFTDPESVFQVLHPALPAEFPPLESVDRTRVLLPLPATPFVGREADLAHVRTQLGQREVRLVTVTGPGGVGKTRLAIEAAFQVAELFPDGVMFVDLAPVSEPALVLSTLATALGFKEQGAQSLLETLIHALANQQRLLVLDNCEHVLAAAQDLAKLLAAVPRLCILATSRARLGISAEHEVPLAPMAVVDPTHLPALSDLAMIDSVQLFVARAQTFKPEFALTRDNASAIARICVRLDGLPLAIELAAARVKLLPPAALLHRLERRLPLLIGGARDLPARQRTLRDTIAWSHDLLSLEEQTLFRRLAVFAGGWTLEGAEAVVNRDDSLDLFSNLASLVDKSLVHQIDRSGSSGRFSMLETMREFGLEQLALSEEDGSIRNVHARFYLDLAERWGPTSVAGAGLGDRVAHLAEEEANLRAALEYFEAGAIVDDFVRLAGSLAIFWYARGQLSEGRRWLDRAITMNGVTEATRARALFGASWLARFQGDSARALTLLEESLTLSRAIGDSWEEAQALLLLGTDLLFQGEFDRAEVTLGEALQRYRERGDDAEVALTLDQLGVLAGFRGDSTLSLTLLEDALRIQRQLHDAFGAAYSLSSLAYNVHVPRGEVVIAAQRLRESLELNREAGGVPQLAWCFCFLAQIASVARPVAAARLLGAEATVRAITGAAIPPVEQSRHQQIVEAVRGQLTPEAFTAASSAGAALLLDDAVTEALELAAELARGMT